MIEPVTQALLRRLNPEDITAVVQQIDRDEVDEMWSYVGNKEEQRWLWHAIDHATSTVLAYILGRRKMVKLPPNTKQLQPTTFDVG